MARRQLHDVRPSQVWRDRDKRMLSGDRQVMVTSTFRQGDTVGVKYRAFYSGEMHGQEFTSRWDRFQRAFDLISEAGEPRQP